MKRTSIFATINEEDKLKNFRQKNRNILSSPELLLEQTRLIRNVEVQSQLYITLLSQYELVSIEESENFSFIEILDGLLCRHQRYTQFYQKSLHII